MFSRISAKLKSNTGATLLMALIFFLLCAVCGAVILTAGSSASGRIAGLAESEQEYYSVASAAGVLEDAINGQGFQVYTENPGIEYPQYTQQPDGELAPILNAAIESVYKNGNAYSEKLKITPSEGQEQMGTVTADFNMDLNYNITISLKNEGSDRYKCTLKVKAIVKEWTTTYEYTPEDGGDPYTVTRTDTQVYWNDCIIEKGTESPDEGVVS